MALAGPAANFSLMLLAGIAIRVGLAGGYFVSPKFIQGFGGLVLPANSSEPNFITSALSILFILNLLLGTFNLLPVPPLDGRSSWWPGARGRQERPRASSSHRMASTGK